MNVATGSNRSPGQRTSCRCGAHYETGAFERLAVVRVLDVEEIAPLVVRWPDGVVVDVRACSACSAPLARLSRSA